ncbi:hypothetical protein JCM1393_19330 [Clostridium carnis]
MLRLEPIEFFLRAIPESFLFMFAIYSFSGLVINKKKYIISSSIYSIVAFSVRMLPITYGVHMVITIIIAIVLSHIYNKIDVIKSIKSVMIMFIIQFISEWINIFLIENILNKNINIVFSNVKLKSIYGLPSLLIGWIIVSIYYIYIVKRKNKNE